jgi:hypothetical protein
MALKFLVDGEQSVDLVFALDWNNTPGWDFFPREGTQAKPFTNHPAPFDTTDTCERVTVAAKLHESTRNAFSTGTGHMAEITQYGTDIANVVFPFELLAYVNYDAIPLYDGVMHPFEYLQTIEASNNVPLFNVYARADPESTPVEIGEIYTQSDQTTSMFGDEQLFFRHEEIEEDIERLQRTDRIRSRTWDNWMRARIGRPPIADWDDDNIESMPAGQDMQTVVELSSQGLFPGAEGLTCPFAWLIANKTITNGILQW